MHRRERERIAANGSEQLEADNHSQHTNSGTCGIASTAGTTGDTDQEIYKQFELLFTTKVTENIDEQITKASQKDLQYLEYFEESMKERHALVQVCLSPHRLRKAPASLITIIVYRQGKEQAREEEYREVQGRVKEER